MEETINRTEMQKTKVFNVVNYHLEMPLTMVVPMIQMVMWRLVMVKRPLRASIGFRSHWV